MTTQRQRIAIRLTRAAQLFKTFDPSPYPERDLDPSAAEHLESWARELPARAPLEIVVELPEAEAAGPEAAHIPADVAYYFADRAAAAGAELRETFRVGRLWLAVGVVALGAALFGSQTLPPLVASARLARLLEESLVLFGWVAMWRPIEAFLYDWWPIWRRRRLLRRLAAAKVTVRVAGGPPRAGAG